MKPTSLFRLLPILAYAACVPGSATQVEFTAGAPPPPPPVVVEPPVVAVEGGVYVATEPSVQYDLFRFGSYWYAYSGGYWYQAPSYRGPFTVVEPGRVPRPVVEVPPGHWKHHPQGGPPGLARGRERREGHGDHDD